MRVRFLLLALGAALVSANPLTLVFTGVGTGTLGSDSFTDQNFSFTFNMNTMAIIMPSDCPGEPTDYCTGDIPATFSTTLDNGMADTVTLDDIGVFVNPTEARLGIWQQSLGTDWLTITDTTASSPSKSPLATYTFSVPPDFTFDATGGEVTALSPTEGSLTTTTGLSLAITSATSLDFSGSVTPTVVIPPPPTPGGTGTVGATAAPEPSTASLLLLGGGGILLGLYRRRR